MPSSRANRRDTAMDKAEAKLTHTGKARARLMAMEEEAKDKSAATADTLHKVDIRADPNTLAMDKAKVVVAMDMAVDGESGGLYEDPLSDRDTTTVLYYYTIWISSRLVSSRLFCACS